MEVRFSGDIAGRFSANFASVFLHGELIAPDLVTRAWNSEYKRMVNFSNMASLKKCPDFDGQRFGTRAQNHAGGRRIQTIQEIEAPSFAILLLPFEIFSLWLIARGEKRPRLVARFIGVRENTSGFGQGHQAVGIVLDDSNVSTKGQTGPKSIRRSAH